MEALQPIEGVTPWMLWPALIVLIALATLYVLYGKVRETYRKQQEYKRVKNDPGERLADEISKKVIASMEPRLEPRFSEINKKLANDKTLIEAHTRQIAAIEKRQDGFETGQKAGNRGILALLNHELHNGNSDEMEKAKQVMDDYLIEK